MRNLFNRFIQICLDTTISGKLIGMLVVSLLSVLILVFFNTNALERIAERNRHIQNNAIPRYQISSQLLQDLNAISTAMIQGLNNGNLPLANGKESADWHLDEMEDRINSLLHDKENPAKTTTHSKDSPIIEDAVHANLDEIAQRLFDSLQIARSNYQAFSTCLSTHCPTDEKQALITDLTQSLDLLHTLIIAKTAEINTRQDTLTTELLEIIDGAQAKTYTIGLIIALVLTIATTLYLLVIVLPLRNILDKITAIANDQGDQAKHIEVKSNDEVGQLAHQLNTLIDNIFNLNAFKAIIEEEETTTAVNKRLAHLLEDRYKLQDLYIYEQSGNKNNLTVAYASNFKHVCHPDIFDNAQRCRAKRTGHAICSLEFPNICQEFPHGDLFEHHCIPMLASGKVVGIVQFLFRKDSSPQARKKFLQLVKKASRYIKEATPVIEAKRFASALHETTMRDAMTDLYNRRFLETYSDTLVASTTRRNSRVGILMCDMDYFKEVNDTYGHETGDMVLVKTAEVLKSCVRTSDLIIRYGGEEFIVLLIDVKNESDTLDLAERIRQTMESTIINVPDGTLQKTLSIGASEFPKDTDGFWEAIKFADVALYKAKEAGRNRVVRFTSEMWKQAEY